MKRTSLILFLFLTIQISWASHPSVVNYSKEDYHGGAQNWAFARVEGGCLYVANNSGLLEYDGYEWNLYQLPNRRSVRSVYCDPDDGRVYVGGSNEFGFWSCASDGFKYTSVLAGSGLTVSEIWNIHPTDVGMVFEEKNTAYLWDGNNISSTPLSSKPELIVPKALEPYGVSSVYCTASSSKYQAVGTITDGVWILEVETGNVIHLTTLNGLQNNSVLCMLFDDCGGLWLGLDRGIDYVMLSSPEYELLDDQGVAGAGYAAQYFEGQLYLGTNQGLYIYENGSVRNVANITGQVWDLQTIGDILFCCHDKGVYMIRGGQVRHIWTQGAWKVERLAPDVLLCCSYEKLFTLRRSGQWWKFGEWVSGFEESSKVFLKDYDDRVWFSHHIKGLYRLTLSDDFSSVINVEHFGTQDGFPTDYGNVPLRYRGSLLFTTEGGFYRFDNTTALAAPNQDLNSLFETNPNSASVFESSNGLRYFSSGGLQAIEYRSASGRHVLDSLTFQPLLGRRILGFDYIGEMPDGNLLLNTEDGFVILVPTNLLGRAEHGCAPAFIQSVELRNLSAESAVSTTVFSSRRQGIKDPITLPNRFSALIFQYRCPEFDNRSNVQFSTMLDGYDKTWSDWNSAIYRDYARLRPGRYTFKVRARANSQVESAIDELTVIIPVPIGLSWWAILSYLAVLSCLAFFARRAARKYLARRSEKIAQKKTRELEQEQLRLEFEHKAHDLAASTMNLLRKNEMLRSMDSDLQRIIDGLRWGRDHSDIERMLQELRREINQNIAHDADWNKFAKNFDIVYEDYLKRLGAKYPNLSVNDKKLCAYLRMGLCSKEIAPLLDMTVRSVEMTRSRLRTKLGLNREENLSEFLQKF